MLIKVITLWLSWSLDRNVLFKKNYWILNLLTADVLARNRMSDYTDIKNRLSAFLHDSGSLIYSSAYLDEALAQALSSISIVLGSSPVLTVNGFQGATSTTLPVKHFSVLVQGAAAFCFIGRSGKRSEITNLNQQVPDSIISIARSNLTEFKRSLEIIRQANIQSAANPPYPSSSEDPHWPLDDREGESIY